MSIKKFLTPCAVALACMASPAHALFTESTNGSTTTLTENFNGSFSSFTGAQLFAANYSGVRDGAAWLHAGYDSMTATFSSFAAISKLTLSFWYTGGSTDPVGSFTSTDPVGSFTLSNSSGFTYTSSPSLNSAAGMNPGLGEAAQGVPGAPVTQSFSNLAAGDYTLTFARIGSNQIKIDDVSLSITPVPEPSTIALMLAGLSIVGFAARRNKRSQ